MRLLERIDKRTFFVISAIALVLIGVYLFTNTNVLDQGTPSDVVDISPYIEPDEEFEANKNLKERLQFGENFNFRSNTPQTGAVYEYQPGDQLSDSKITDLISKLDLDLKIDNTDQVLGRVILAQKLNKTLTIYFEKNELQYLVNLGELPPYLKNEIQPEQYETKAREFINNLGINMNQYEFTHFKYLAASNYHAAIVNNPSVANVVELYFEARVDGIPIIDGISNTSGNRLTVWPNNNQEVVKFNFQGVGTVGNKVSSLSLKEIAEVKRDLMNNKATLIGGTFQLDGDGQAQAILAHDVHLAYLSTEDKLIPVYVISAFVTSSEEKQTTGYMIMYAAKEKY